MTTTKTDNLFERFRTTGSSRDLAAVFDATASELLRVALHLQPDRAAAEDLVQATFVTAIERADRFEPGRSVQKWFLGILNNHARNLRRRRRALAVDEVGLEQLLASTTPEESAEARELRAQFRSSLAAVPQPYRQVVQLRLVEELSTEDIAVRLSRPSGTVRTQCHRGMEFLRKAMPSGVALAALAGLVPARGLAAVRAEVLAGAGSAVAVGGTVWTGMFGLRTVAVVVVLATVGVYMWPAPPAEDRVVETSPDKARVEQVAEHGAGDVPGEGSRVAVPAAVETAAGSAGDGPGESAAGDPPKNEVFLEFVDGRGRPVPKARVEFEPTELASHFSPRFRHPVTRTADERGRLRGEIPDHIGFLIASKAGVGTSGVLALDKTWRGTGQPRRIVLHRFVISRGRLLGVDGVPVVGGEVRASTDGFGHRVTVRTDAAGEFQLPLDRAGLYEVEAKFENRRTDTYVLDARAVPSELVIHLRGAYAIHGQVVLPNGAPAVGAKVELREREGHPNKPQGWGVETTADGAFRFELSRPGDYWLVATHERSPGSDVVDVRLSEGVRVARPRVQLAAFARIGGSVQLADGRPLGGVRVLAVAPHARGCEAKTDAGGRFLFDKVHPRRKYVVEVFASAEQRSALGVASSTLGPGQKHGIYLIMCSDGRQRVHRHVGVAAGDLEVAVVVPAASLETGGVIGRIVADATGEPIESFQGRLVEIHPDRVGDKNFWSDKRGPGTFSIGGIPLGLRVQLEVRVDGYATGWYGPYVVQRGDKEIELRLQKPGAVRCTVYRDGQPFVGARVTTVAKVARPERYLAPPVHSGVGGVATVRLAPGRFEVTATHGTLVGRAVVDVRADAEARIDLRLAPPR